MIMMMIIVIIIIVIIIIIIAIIICNPAAETTLQSLSWCSEAWLSMRRLLRSIVFLFADTTIITMKS